MKRRKQKKENKGEERKKESKYTEKDFYKLGEYLSKTFYSQNHKDFKEMAMDIEDVIQETNYTIYKLYCNKRLSGITFPLVKQAVKWRLLQLIANYRSSKGEANITYIDDIYLTNDGESNPLDSLLTTDIEIPVFNSPWRLFCNLFDFNQLKQILEPNDYYIIYCICVDNNTYKEVGEKIGVSKQAIEQKYKTILAYIKNKIEEGDSNEL